MSGFRQACHLVLGSFILLEPVRAFDPGGELVLRLYSRDSPSFEQRDLPRRPAEESDRREGAGRLTIGGEAEPADQLRLKLSALSAARWGADDNALLEAGESFVKGENIAMTPLSVSAGRQALSWGRGLLFSDENRDHLFDMASVCWDTLPHRFDLLLADSALTVFDSPVNRLGLVRWFYQSAGRSSAEIFGGAMSLEDDGATALAGARGALASGPAWETWAELAGEAGERNSETDLAALMADLGIVRRFSKGRIQTSWTWASGSDDEVNSFVPLFNGEQWGRLYDPPLSNIHVFTASATRDLPGGASLSAEYFSYWQADDGERLGCEVDLAAACDLSDSLAVEMSGCLFFTDGALRPMDDNTQSEIRFQLSAAF